MLLSDGGNRPAGGLEPDVGNFSDRGGMTQAELAEATGVTRQTVITIEQARYSPSLESAFRIAHVFGAKLEDVFHWENVDLSGN